MRESIAINFFSHEENFMEMMERERRSKKILMKSFYIGRICRLDKRGEGEREESKQSNEECFFLK